MLIFFIALDIVSSSVAIKPFTMERVLNMKYTLSLAPIVNFIIAFIIGTMLINYIGKSPTENGKNNKKMTILMAVAYVITVVVMVLSGYLLGEIKIYTFTNIPILIIIAMLIALIGVVKLISDTVISFRLNKRTKI